MTLGGQTIGALFVSRNYFDVLGIRMERGPGFEGPEGGREDVAVISYDLWQQHLNGDTGIVGRAVSVNDAELTVVGVATRDFRGTSFGRKELWLPFGARPLVHPHAPDLEAVRMAGRLAPTMFRQQAAAELEGLSRTYRSGLASQRTRGDRLLQQGRINLTPTNFNPNPGKRVKDADTAGRQLGRLSGTRVAISQGGGQFVETMIYRRFDASLLPSAEVLARGTTGSAASVAAELARVDRRIHLQVRSLKDNLDRQFAPSRMGALVAGILAVLALTFASIGVFGVFAYIVQQRTREIGVRMALGARPGQVIRFVVRSSSPALLIGVVLGFGGAIAGSRMIQSSLLGISALDPVAYAAVLAILACAAFFAVVVPSSRATRVDPVTALRCE